MLVPKNNEWDQTAEIVVVGYGLAGSAAAITARDSGASVVIVEKQSAYSHCSSSSMSGGLFVSPSDADKAIEYLKALYEINGVSWTDMDTIRAWAKYAVQNKDWLKSLGGNIRFFAKSAEFPQLPGADSIELWRYQGRGLRMMQFMYEQVNFRNIGVMYETPAQRLLTNEDGEVIGIRVTSGKKEIDVKASKGVILCSGGFEANEEMKLQYLRVYPTYFAGGQANTGDGINMAQEVGATLWHMSCVSARMVAKFPDFPLAFAIEFGGPGLIHREFTGKKEKAAIGYIIVDKYGRRYMSENFKPHAAAYQLAVYDADHLEYPRVPSYYIFDQRRMERGPLCHRAGGPAGPHQLYTWSLDNTAELQRGWVVKGRTAAELAEKLDMSSAVLQESVQLWNEHCEKGRDSHFDRDPLELVPLDRPPFYAIRLFPGGANTQGGPRRNSRAQVLNPFGDPVPGLYAAGECGSIYGMLYPNGGCNLAECIAFGRIAAENAVAETEKP